MLHLIIINIFCILLSDEYPLCIFDQDLREYTYLQVRDVPLHHLFAHSSGAGLGKV